ncbi:Pentatricopeptide repeat-containing protein -chloroplastic [Striga hermonthica]|uniref:Pentatricopeptide repeat-containing protein -chloroplastic n=1 Tax=Striga hermonthica TaxID=68872 RepID=A0A9N7RPU4_STRHE|nr:Pentatricopeptide repeat-containing protein -chloroplastic [Striga hermonthica]
MEGSTLPSNLPNTPPRPNVDKIKQKLLKRGVEPSPKILHNLRKKELQKSNRRLAKQASKMPPPLTDAQKQSLLEELHFQTIKSEYKKFTRENTKLVGKPWEKLERIRLRELAGEEMEYGGERLNQEHLSELSDVIELERDKFSWLLDNDIELEEGLVENDGTKWAPPKRREPESINLLIHRLSGTELSVKDWKFTRMMRYSGLQFTEDQMLKIVEGLGNKGQWRHAVSVVEWVYNSKEHKHFRSRFVYTKLLKVLGRARKASESLKVFNLMRGDAHIYPDMAAYHCLAVTLGQAGLIKELLSVVEFMKEKPKKIRNMRRKNWNPELQPDIVIFNAILNACVQKCQWKGVSWVFQQLRKNGLRPNGASYGLAMEVMLKSGKYDLVHEFFEKMKKNGVSLKALTYKVLVKALWEEGKVNDAVQAVRDMERRGVIGTASVYYELARCLCFYGRREDALLEIEKLKNLRPTKSLAVTFTGMIMSSLDGGHIQDCILLYEHSITLMAPNIGLINAMLKVYGRHDMFLKARELFEETRKYDFHSEIGEHDHNFFLKEEAYTFSLMLEASASALQWEYFEYVYKEMTLSGYRVDPRKHSVLLVEASRAGKWHLLEHAFTSLLETGEVPHVSLFTEMACQAIIRHDYERALNIINTMAYAPFQVSFQDWINLFEINQDRVDQCALNELHDKLVSRDLIKEATVLNLSKALKFICGSCEGSSRSPEDGVGEQNVPLISDHLDSVWNHESTLVNSLHKNYTSDDKVEEKDMEGDFGLSKTSLEENDDARATRLAENFDFDLVSKSWPSDSYEIEFENIEREEGDSDTDDFDLGDMNLRSKVDEDSRKSDMPSAYEILEIWKKR